MILMCTERRMPDIIFEYPDSMPKSLAENFLEGIDRSGPDVRVHAQAPRVWASLEIVVPGVIMVFITKAYFDGYLKEAGKDHYRLTKRWLGSLAKKCHGLSPHIHQIASDERKLNRRSPYSKALSVYYLTKQGNRVKLVYNSDMSADDWEKLTVEFAAIMQQHYSEYPNDPISQVLSEFPQDEMLLAVMDPDEGWKLGNWKTFLPKEERGDFGSIHYPPD